MEKLTMSLATDTVGTSPRSGFASEHVDLTQAKILVVDDSPLIRELIGACLTADNYKNISYAGDGIEALEHIEKDMPDLIILDLEMPQMDGFEVCKRLRQDPKTENIPILIQSGRDTAADITRAFDYGASDMVVKPVKKFEILARTKVHLQKRMLLQKLISFHTRVASELEQAKRLQLDICPSPEELEKYRHDYGVDICWHYEPSSELGGDMGGVFPISKNKFAFFIADFSGHGVAAALNTFRLQTWLTAATDLYETPGTLMAELNNFLKQNLPSGSYATMLFSVLDLKKEMLTYAAAGCQPPLVQRPDQSTKFKLYSSTGMPLGLRANWTYESHQVPFGYGSKFLLYSDALVEVPDGPDKMLGDDGLLVETSDIWKNKPSLQSAMDTLIHNYNKRLKGLTGSPDDLTVILLENTNERTKTE